MGELKPCPNPWCVSTSKPVALRYTLEQPSGWRVSCGCGVQTYRVETSAEAITAWNTRPRTEGRGDAIGQTEGHSEPVAWRYRWRDHMYGAMAEWSAEVDYDRAVQLARQDGEVRPLFDHPAPIREPEISRPDREAMARVRKYLGELSKMRSVDREEIHGLHIGDDREAVLRASDLHAILNLAPVGGRGEEGSSQSQPVLSPKIDTEGPFHAGNLIGKPLPEHLQWKGPGPAPASWFVDGVKVYRSYADYCDD